MVDRIGTAGWNVPKHVAAEFPEEGSHLYRYSRRFSAVEINSSFYRPHRSTTYLRWAETVPPAFKFAVKAPGKITHEMRLIDTEETLHGFLSDTQGLGDKLGPILVQLPPSLAFDETTVRAFFKALRRFYSGQVVCEPRHLTWLEPIADSLMNDFQIARAVADPALNEQAKNPGGWPGLVYWRLHGSPDMYRSSYHDDALRTLANVLNRQTSESWCIFDNTTFGKAAENALWLKEIIKSDCVH
jgi:uncharacterized protein YecE (DUF72 family)